MISIVIPTYNREKTIKNAIESVLKQTYKDIEVIVVDDCSTDNTEEIVRAMKDDRIIYYKLNQNSGACVARNKGIELAKGSYIAFQDSDDIWKENKLEKQIKIMEETKASLNFCKISVIGEKSKKVNVKPTITDERNIKKYGIVTALCKNNFISTQAIIGRKECFENIKFDSMLPRLQDFDIVLRLCEKFEWSFCNESLVDVYVQDDSISADNVKLIKALSIIRDKQYRLSKKDKKELYTKIYKDLGDSYRGKDKNEVLKNYKKSLKIRFSIKLFIKYILNLLKR